MQWIVYGYNLSTRLKRNHPKRTKTTDTAKIIILQLDDDISDMMVTANVLNCKLAPKAPVSRLKNNDQVYHQPETAI